MADRENFMGGRHRTTRPHAVTAQRRGLGLYWLPFQRGYDRCRITIHRESPRPRPATSENNLIHALAWFGSTISRAPFHAGGRTVERSAYRILFFIFLQQRPEHGEHARHEEQVTDYGHEHVRKVDAHGAQPTSNCSSNAPVKHFQARNHAG